MSETRTNSSKGRSILRLALFGSAAGFGMAVLASGSGAYLFAGLPEGITAAHAASLSAQTLEANFPHPASFADLVAKVKPAVISVRVRFEEAANAESSEDDGIPFAPGSPMEKFFQQFGFPPNAMPQHPEIITGEGSGFFISADGYAVTNNHVVNNARSVQVTTDDGKIYTAKVIGTDPKTDLALIKIDGKTDFPFVKFSDELPRVGDWVVAVGNPFGLGGTVTAGIVSARGRDIGAGPYDDYIQIDAPINSGNSGGPAFNVDGAVIGVNTAIYSPSGGSVGIGFDIPAATAKLVIAQLKEHGSVTRGWLGVQVQQITPGIAESLGMKKAEGALVDEAKAGSPAAKAGVQTGDVLTAINGSPIKDSRGLARNIGALAPNTSVKVDILRKGESKTLTVTLAKMPNEKQANAESRAMPPNESSHLGLSVKPAQDVAGMGTKGVVVTAVDPGGPAAQQGIAAGDVILDVGGKTVANPNDVRKAVAQAKAEHKHDVLMRVKSAKATLFVAVPIGKG